MPSCRKHTRSNWKVSSPKIPTQDSYVLPALGWNSGDDDYNTLPTTNIAVQVAKVGRSSFEGSGSEDLFLDLDKSDDERTMTAMNKKKNKRKKKRATPISPTSVVEKSQDEIDTIADLDKWLSKGAPLTRKAALRTDRLVQAAKSAMLRPCEYFWKRPASAFFWSCPWALETA